MDHRARDLKTCSGIHPLLLLFFPGSQLFSQAGPLRLFSLWVISLLIFCIERIGGDGLVLDPESAIHAPHGPIGHAILIKPRAAALRAPPHSISLSLGFHLLWTPVRVRVVGVVVGDARWFAAVSVHDVDLPVAVSHGGKRDAAAVW